ncbi:MAG: VCBS repeat-containing protein, partial [Alphaproteobacteria bacterium]|nr:VCBS repeat-containing protein [Alphaproteobacteria bacterium]
MEQYLLKVVMMTFSAVMTLGTLLDSNRVTSGDPQQIEVGDFNGDGKIDFVISRTIGEGYIPTDMRFMLNLGNGKWEDKTDLLFPGGAPKTQYGKPIVADFNNDGKSDIYVVVYGIHSPDGTGGYDQVWLATDSGQMKVASVSNILARKHGVSIGDINQDGYLDVVLDTVDSKITNPTADLIMINDGKGNFSDNQNLLPLSQRTGSQDRLTHTASLLIDLTGDGAPELVLGTWEGGVQKLGAKPNYSPPSEILINDGHGNYSNSSPILLPQSPIDPESVMDIDSIDINNDGLNDLILDITRGGNGTTGQYYGTGYL